MHSVGDICTSYGHSYLLILFPMFVGFPHIINPTSQHKGQKCAFLDFFAAKI